MERREDPVGGSDASSPPPPRPATPIPSRPTIPPREGDPGGGAAQNTDQNIVNVNFITHYTKII